MLSKVARSSFSEILSYRRFDCLAKTFQMFNKPGHLKIGA
jgi:hypothetical protein